MHEKTRQFRILSADRRTDLVQQHHVAAGAHVALPGLPCTTCTVTGCTLRIGHGVAERGRTAALARQHQLQGAGVFFITHDGQRSKTGARTIS